MAFTVTGPDLSRALTRLAEQAGRRRRPSSPPQAAASAVSPEAPTGLLEQREESHEQS
ncbi:MAG: hypothetical protein ACTHJ3_00105 [Pararhizobium sp.]